MLQIQISKEIREYKPKFVGQFTLREAAAIVCAAGLVGIVFYVEKSILQLQATTFVPAIPLIAVPLFFGFGERFLHMPPEKWITTVFAENFKKKSRPYKTHNYYSIMLHKQQMLEASQEENQKGRNEVKKEEKPRKLPPELKGFA